jgi:2-oxoglutarate ferredoxin oxidoreductase subunit alpha
MGQMMEPVELPEPTEYNKEKDWAVTGTKCQRKHNIINSLYLQPDELEKTNIERFERYKVIEENETMYEEFMMEDAEICVAAFGIAARISKNAIMAARAEGIKVGMIRPITLYPFPKASLDNLDYSKVKGIIDVEMTIPAQMRDDIELQVKGRCPVHEYGRSGGVLLDDEGVYDAIAEIVKGGE